FPCSLNYLMECIATTLSELFIGWMCLASAMSTYFNQVYMDFSWWTCCSIRVYERRHSHELCWH
ncbi:MAG: hypothetical protein PHQ50_06800, partial [Eubacteriales bacterium]|nr:hypothetical protein [Eubacteriales bacterium]